MFSGEIIRDQCSRCKTKCIFTFIDVRGVLLKAC